MAKSDKPQVNTDVIRLRLEEFHETERDIDNQIERLEHLKAKLYAAGAQVLTDMPRSPSASNDRMAAMLAQADELDSTIRGMVKSQSEEKKRIEYILMHIRKSDERAVIRMRYFDGADWKEIAEMLFGDRDDYLEREDTFVRRAFRVRDDALTHMTIFIEESGEGNMAAQNP